MARRWSGWRRSVTSSIGSELGEPQTSNIQHPMGGADVEYRTLNVEGEDGVRSPQLFSPFCHRLAR